MTGDSACFLVGSPQAAARHRWSKSRLPQWLCGGKRDAAPVASERVDEAADGPGDERLISKHSVSDMRQSKPIG